MNAAAEILKSEVTEEIEVAMGVAQERIRSGDFAYIYELFKVAWEPDYSDQERAMALEVLACARNPEILPLVEILIERYLTEMVNTRLRLEAIACLCEVPLAHIKERFLPELKLIAKSNNKKLNSPAKAAMRGLEYE